MGSSRLSVDSARFGHSPVEKCGKLQRSITATRGLCWGKWFVFVRKKLMNGWAQPQLYAHSVVLPRRVGPPPSEFKLEDGGHLAPSRLYGNSRVFG